MRRITFESLIRVTFPHEIKAREKKKDFYRPSIVEKFGQRTREVTITKTYNWTNDLQLKHTNIENLRKSSSAKRISRLGDVSVSNNRAVRPTTSSSITNG